MKSTSHSFHPDTHWGIAGNVEPAATPFTRSMGVVPVSGAGPQAQQLYALFCMWVLGTEPDLAELGWEPPPPGLIPMKLAGIQDLDWHLDLDELKP